MDKGVKALFLPSLHSSHLFALQCFTHRHHLIKTPVFCLSSQKYHGQGGKTPFLMIFYAFTKIRISPPIFLRNMTPEHHISIVVIFMISSFISGSYRLDNALHPLLHDNPCRLPISLDDNVGLPHHLPQTRLLYLSLSMLLLSRYNRFRLA